MNETPKGRRVEMVVNGKVTTLGTIGELAAAVGRTTNTIRRWERTGLIPKAPLILDPSTISARRRLYPVELIDELRQMAERERFGRRRPSGVFPQQQKHLWDMWRSVIDELVAGGVMDDSAK